MKFSAVAVLAVTAPFAAGFTTPLNQRTSFVTSSSRFGAKYDLDVGNLEKLVLEEPKPAEKPKKEARKPKKEAPKPAPTPPPAPKPTAKASKYDLGGVEGKPKPVKAPPAPKPKVEKPKPAPKVKTPKPAPAPKAAVEKDPNAVPAGIALGAAPLVLAPVALLAGGRGILSSTKARRDKIQKEIEEFEAAKAKAKKDAEIDAGGLTAALVSISKFMMIFQ